MDQELVVPRLSCLILLAHSPLNWREILQIDIDVGEIVMLCLSLFEKLHDNRQSFLLQDLNRVDRSVQNGYLMLPPLFRLVFLLRVN